MLRSLLLVALAASSVAAQASPIVFSAAGFTAPSIVPAVSDFRAALGTLNPNLPGSFAGGRREINWDGVPDAFSAPNGFPAGFFNENLPGRARGVVTSTPGTGFQVSAASPTATPVDFGNIDFSYPEFFEPFSPQRLFTALNSTITDVAFFVPGSTTPAVVSGFGVVFSDVDLANTTSLQFFDAADASLGTFAALAIVGDETFSFLGVLFNAGEQVARVRITSGNQALAPGNLLEDLVVMDDFIYAEPQVRIAAVPEPSGLILLGLGLGAFALSRRRRT
jgi:hypothetical protein